jgi:hypothetical protein
MGETGDVDEAFRHVLGEGYEPTRQAWLDSLAPEPPG